MDGTLLRKDHQLSDTTKEYIRLLPEKYPDMIPVLCTGRPKSGILPYLKDLGMKDYNAYVISQNGANIFESMTEKRIYDALLNTHQLQDWLDLIQQHQIGLMGAGIEAYFTYQEKLNQYMTDDIELINGQLLQRTKETFLKEDLYKLLLFESKELLDEFESHIPEKFREDFYVVRSQPYLIEVLPKNINKSSGLRELSKILEIELSEIMAVGDAMNDYEMLQEVGFSVAMGNASQSIKDIADFVTLTNEEDGVIYAISHWIKELQP